MKTWSEIYTPKNINEIYGQDFAVAKLRDFIVGYNKQKNKAAIVHGPPGVGKTCSVYAIAHELNYEILELNASDYRNSENIDAIIKPAISQKSLFYRNKIIFIDELDGIAGTEDYGGVQTLVSLIESSKFPIIIAANDPWNKKLANIRKKSTLIEFKNLNYLNIYKVLEKISKKINIYCSEDSLKQIAMVANGDLRAALNDFQALTEGKKSIILKDLEVIASRNKKDSVFNALRIIFKTKNIQEVLNTINTTDLDLDEATLWIDENIPLEYSGSDITKAYNSLSRADVFKGRVSRQQYYRFLVYQSNLMTAGVSLAKSKQHQNYTPYRRTSRILKYWIAKNKYQKRKSISEKLAAITHSSSKKALKSTFPYIKIIFQKNKGQEIAKYLELNEDEIEYLNSK